MQYGNPFAQIFTHAHTPSIRAHTPSLTTSIHTILLHTSFQQAQLAPRALNKVTMSAVCLSRIRDRLVPLALPSQRSPQHHPIRTVLARLEHTPTLAAGLSLVTIHSTFTHHSATPIYAALPVIKKLTTRTLYKFASATQHRPDRWGCLLVHRLSAHKVPCSTAHALSIHCRLLRDTSYAPCPRPLQFFRRAASPYAYPVILRFTYLCITWIN